jgi:hypothetical protein
MTHNDYSDLGIWHIILRNLNEIILSRENNWQYILPMIKFEHLNGKLEFWESYICHDELDNTWTFMIRLVVIVTNTNFWYCIIKHSEYINNGERQ